MKKSLIGLAAFPLILGLPHTSAQGSIYSYKDNEITTATAQSIDSVTISTTYNQNNDLTQETVGTSIPPSATLGGITFTGSAALAHPAAFVTATKDIFSTVQEAAFSAGTLTLPAGWAASGDTITAYATNKATNFAPTANLDATHAYFRVSRADGAADAVKIP